MIVKKFEADSLENVLKLVKSELGPDALILSTQNRKGGWFHRPVVEVTAAFEEKPKEKKDREFDEAQLEKIFPHRRLGKVLGQDEPVDANLRGTRTRRSSPQTHAPLRASAPKPQLPPQVKQVEKDFLDLGINPETAQEFAGRVMLDFGKSDREDPSFMDKVKSKLLASGMKTLGREVFDSRRCWAVVGTPGSGKTSLLVKLGLFLRNQKQNVSLVSCDRRKLLGRQELAAYAKLIRIPFSTEIKGDRVGAKVQLIDTPSMSWENKEVTQEVEKVCRDMNTLLVLDASQRLTELLRTVESSASLAPVALAFTRLDTIAQAGVIYELLKSVKLPLLGASVSHSFSTPFQFFEPIDLARWIVAKVRS